MSLDLARCLEELKKVKSTQTLEEERYNTSNKWIFLGRADRSSPLNYQSWRRIVFGQWWKVQNQENQQSRSAPHICERDDRGTGWACLSE